MNQKQDNSFGLRQLQSSLNALQNDFQFTEDELEFQMGEDYSQEEAGLTESTLTNNNNSIVVDQKNAWSNDQTGFLTSSNSTGFMTSPSNQPSWNHSPQQVSTMFQSTSELFTNFANRMSSESQLTHFITMEMDMAFEDRILFGCHMEGDLRRKLIEAECAIDFDGKSGKVILKGPSQGVIHMSRMLTEALSDHLSFEAFGTESRKLGSFFSVSPSILERYSIRHKIVLDPLNENSIVFKLFFRRDSCQNVAIAIFQLAAFGSDVGIQFKNFHTTIMIPSIRKSEMFARGNCNLQEIQERSTALIEIVRHQYGPTKSFDTIKISGSTYNSVSTARQEIFSSFMCDLIFSQPVADFCFIQAQIIYIANQHDVAISVDPDVRLYGHRTFTLSTKLERLFHLFTVRQEIMMKIMAAESF